MAVYKEEKTNTWRAVYRYTDWNGERKQTQKRGFKTKREAQAWEREQLNKTSADLVELFPLPGLCLPFGLESPLLGLLALAVPVSIAVNCSPGIGLFFLIDCHD